MVFDEERQRKRTKNGAYNFSFIRKMALNFLKQDTSKGSMVISINLNVGSIRIKFFYKITVDGNLYQFECRRRRDKIQKRKSKTHIGCTSSFIIFCVIDPYFHFSGITVIPRIIRDEGNRFIIRNRFDNCNSIKK